MDLAFENDVIFYFNADTERLAIILVGHSIPLWPSSFQDRFHVFGGCFHTGFHLTALTLTNIYYSCRKETGRRKNERDEGEKMERFLAYNFYYNLLHYTNTKRNRLKILMLFIMLN